MGYSWWQNDPGSQPEECTALLHPPSCHPSHCSCSTGRNEELHEGGLLESRRPHQTHWEQTLDTIYLKDWNGEAVRRSYLFKHRRALKEPSDPVYWIIVSLGLSECLCDENYSDSDIGREIICHSVASDWYTPLRNSTVHLSFENQAEYPKHLCNSLYCWRRNNTKLSKIFESTSTRRKIFWNSGRYYPADQSWPTEEVSPPDIYHTVGVTALSCGSLPQG